jgi:hypothetical protein
MQDGRMSDRVRAAVEVAGRLGIEVVEPVVLRGVTSTLVHLAPSPAVARVWPTGRGDPVMVAHELEVTTYLASRGAPVAAPYAEPGRYDASECTVTLWLLVDHDPDRTLDARAAGQGLREIHSSATRRRPTSPTFRLAGEREEYLPAARARLALALDGLRATG